MKKIILFTFTFYSFVTYSQDFNKGDKLFGGSFSANFNNVSNGGPTYNTYGNAGIFPSFSWIVKKNLAFGIRGNIGYSRTWVKYDNGDKKVTKYLNLGPGVFFRKYKFINDKIGVYFDHEISGSYILNKEKMTNTATLMYKNYGLGYRFTPGLFYKISDRFMAEGNIGGAYLSYYGGGGFHNIGTGASFLQYFNFGFNYLLNKTKS